MVALLSALPVLSTIIALGFGARSFYASLLGVGSAVLVVFVAFPMPVGDITAAALRWLPILTEVLLIVGGGLLLSEVLREAGAQAALADWVRGWAGQGVGAVLLVVHGVTPFAESVTGFGIGITIGIPLLVHFGLPARKVAVIGLLGLCAVPWGSMGPGTLIAATMSNLSFRDLGVASAIVSVIPFIVTGIVAALLASPAEDRVRAILQGTLSGIVLTASVAAINAEFGTAPAGALGGLFIIAMHFLHGRGQCRPPLATVGHKALKAYAVLLSGVLAVSWLVRVLELAENWRYIASPAIWLFIATLWFARGLPKTESMKRAWGSWLQVAPVTGLFIVLGVLMAISGMAAFLARTLAGAGVIYLAAIPFVGAIGGFVTGSNSGANAMLASTQGEIARSLGVNVLWFMAIHNVAAAFLLMASPGKVEMAVRLSPAEASEHRRFIQISILLVAVLVVSILSVFSVLRLS